MRRGRGGGRGGGEHLEETIRGEEVGVSLEEDGVEGPGVKGFRLGGWGVRWGLVVRDSGCSCSA